MAWSDDAIWDEIPTRGKGLGPIRFGVIGEAWRMFLASWTTWVVSMIIILVLYGLVYRLASEIVGPVFQLDSAHGLRVIRPKPKSQAWLLHALAATVINGYFLGGLVRMACKQWRGDRFGAADLFGVSEIAGPLAVASLLYWLISSLGFMLCFFPGLIFSSLMMLTWPLVVDARRSGPEAVRESCRLLAGQWLPATLFHAVLGLLLAIGASVCFVGLVVTGPIYALAISRIYLDVTGSKSKPSVRL